MSGVVIKDEDEALSPARRKVCHENKAWQRKIGHKEASIIQKKEVTLQGELDVEKNTINNKRWKVIEDKVMNASTVARKATSLEIVDYPKDGLSKGTWPPQKRRRVRLYWKLPSARKSGMQKMDSLLEWNKKN
ncbi:hypothetical protein V6N13_046267 [Hibiscus sabdariffa]|uniref:Uncharacterized protein n=1 Tax=Hibiscus sabdariffa TaxID=183260 RepID=A0ABR2D9L5_9ROSI